MRVFKSLMILTNAP